MTEHCPADEHSWWVTGFTHAGNREGGGIANLVRRQCERCPAASEQIEVSWPSGRITVEPAPDRPVDWGDKCPSCGGTFPFLYGPHPTWIPCR